MNKAVDRETLKRFTCVKDSHTQAFTTTRVRSLGSLKIPAVVVVNLVDCSLIKPRLLASRNVPTPLTVANEAQNPRQQ